MTLSRDLYRFSIPTRSGEWHFFLCRTVGIQNAITNAYEGDLAYCAADQKLYLRTSSGWAEVGGSGGGAPTDAEYLTGASSSGLSAERVVTNTSTITWDLATAGQAKASVPVGAFEAVGAVATHVALSDPHVQYALESALGALALLNSINTSQLVDDAVTYAKLQNLATACLLGRSTAGSGNAEEISIGSNLTLSGGVLSASGGSGGLTLTIIEKDLGPLPRSSGTFDITGLSGLTSDRPVLMQQSTGPYTGKGTLTDEAEMDQLTVTASVLNPSTIRAYWNSPTFVAGNFKFQYAVG